MTDPEKKSVQEALAQFQAKCPPISMDGFNPHFKSKYATLGHIISTIRPVMAAAGLTFTQPIEGDQLKTILFGPDGSTMDCGWVKIKSEGKAQDLGSDLTYKRRYLLTSALGIAADEDVDANEKPIVDNRKPLASGTDDWDKAVDSVGSGQISADKIIALRKMSAEDAEKLRAVQLNTAEA